MDPAEDIFTDVRGTGSERDDTAVDDASAAGDVVDDGNSAFSSQSCADATERDIYDRSGNCPGSDHGTDDANSRTEVDSVPQESAPQEPANLSTNTEDDARPSEHAEGQTKQDTAQPTSSTNNEGQASIPKGRSLAHDCLKSGKVAFMSFDMETGGEHCGIVQLSAELFRMDLEPKVTKTGESASGDTASNVKRVASTFNSYVNPGEGALFSEASTSVHGLHSTDPRITSADDIFKVWASFTRWLHSNVGPDETVVLVAWNGETCDLKWLWRLTQAPRSTLSLPPMIKYFIDPLRVIRNCKGCKLHPSKSKLDSLELGCVWKFVKGQNLNGAHNSLVDVKAQTDVFVHKHFVPFINRGPSIQPIDAIFTATEQKAMKRDMEPTRPVHEPWEEMNESSDIQWEPKGNDVYTSSHGGGLAGASSRMTQAVRKAKSLQSPRLPCTSVVKGLGLRSVQRIALI